MKKLFSIVIVAFVLLGLIPNPSSAAAQEPILQVKLLNYLQNKTSMSMKVTGTYVIKEKTYKLSPTKTYTVKAASGLVNIYNGTTKLASGKTLTVSSTNRNDHVTLSGHAYLGNFTFTVENSKYVSVTNLVPMEDYVKCVVPAEMYASWNKEALKAQAVAARTYAYFHSNKVINDTPGNYQAYYGMEKLYDNSTAATKETAGEIVTYQGNAIETLFSASNGGMTQNNYNEYGSPALPYFPIKKDPYDTKLTWAPIIQKKQITTSTLNLSRPELWWDKTMEKDQTVTNNIKSWLSRNGYSNKQIKIVSIPKLAFYEKDSSGRAIRGDLTFTFYVKDKFNSKGNLALQTIKKSYVIADNVRDIIGRSVIPSTLISSVTATTTSYTIKGSGNGHGIGLSQHGANNRANAGIQYKSILSFYYPSTAVSKVYEQSYKTINVQLNGKAFNTGYYVNGATHLHWSALTKLNIPFVNKGNGLFVINGRQVQAVKVNNDWYISWKQIWPGNARAVAISGGYNFIYPVAKNTQLNGKAFKTGYYVNGATHLHWTALDQLKIPYVNKGNGLFVINGRQVQAVKVNNDWYISWKQIWPGNARAVAISGGYNFIYPVAKNVQLNGKAFNTGYYLNGVTNIHWTALKTWNIPYVNKGNGLFVIEGRQVKAVKVNNDWYISWKQISPGHVSFKSIVGGYNFIYSK